MAGRPSKLNPQTAEEFLAKLRSSGNVAASADSAGVGIATIYHWLELGRQRRSGPFREFLESFIRARGDYRLYRATRHHRIAIGGIERKPATIGGTSLIRRDENGEVVWEEHWREPNLRALQWEMERDERETYGRLSEAVSQAEIPADVPEPSKAEMEAEAAKYVDLFYNSVKVLVDLGVPLPQIAPPPVETTAEKVSEPDSHEAPSGEQESR
jgi:hypothetical protein